MQIDAKLILVAPWNRHTEFETFFRQLTIQMLPYLLMEWSPTTMSCTHSPARSSLNDPETLKDAMVKQHSSKRREETSQSVNDMSAQSELTQAANKLHLKEKRHDAFTRLALRHLHNTVRATEEYGSPNHVDATTISFVDAYAYSVWPAFPPQRDHLTTSSTITAGAARGLCYAQASNLARRDLKAWKAAHDFREPTENEQLLGSPLGRLLRAYYACMM